MENLKQKHFSICLDCKEILNYQIERDTHTNNSHVIFDTILEDDSSNDQSSNFKLSQKTNLESIDSFLK